MIDPEIPRLRRLRAAALRVRAMGRALSSRPYALNDSLLSHSARVSGRIVRAVSGRLNAHPYLRYQQDAGVGRRVCNSVLAGLLTLGIRNRVRALTEYESQVRRLARQLADARALTLSQDLGASLGRSQLEIKALLEALAQETRSASDPVRLPDRPGAASGLETFANSIQGDWPYLAF
jgi:hypothetical protein